MIEAIDDDVVVLLRRSTPRVVDQRLIRDTEAALPDAFPPLRGGWPTASGDSDDLWARARAARSMAQRLEDRTYELQFETMIVQAEHLLIHHSSLVEARLRVLLEDGAALPEQA